VDIDFGPELCPRPQWGNLQRSSRSLAGGEGACRLFLKIFTHIGPSGLRFRHSLCRPPTPSPQINKSELRAWLLNHFKQITTQQRSQHTMVSPYEEARKLPRERDNARNNARCTQASKTKHSLDGQDQDVDNVHYWPISV